MGKKIVVLTGSPRAGGNTDRMADAFISGAMAAGHEVTKFSTAQLNVKGCVACGGCYSREDRPCCHDDDFNRIAPVIEQADVVVFAAPLYWSTFPAPMKSVIDNCFCFYNGQRKVAGKQAVLLSCGEADSYLMFDGLQRTYELILPTLDWHNAGMILVPNVNEVGDINKTDGLRRCEALGRSI